MPKTNVFRGQRPLLLQAVVQLGTYLIVYSYPSSPYGCCQ